jgi:hypothetical protein
MIRVDWKSTIHIENSLIPSSNFKPKSQGLLPSFWIYVSADHLRKVAWKVHYCVSKSWIAAQWLSIIQRILIVSLNSEHLKTKDRIVSRNIILNFLYRHVFVYGMRCLFIYMNYASEFRFNRIGPRSGQLWNQFGASACRGQLRNQLCVDNDISSSVSETVSRFRKAQHWWGTSMAGSDRFAHKTEITDFQIEKKPPDAQKAVLKKPL